MFVILAITVSHSNRISEATATITRTRQVLLQINKVLLLFVDNETDARGYVITNRPEYMEPVLRSERLLLKETDTLQKLLSDHPGQLALMDSLTAIVKKHLKFSHKMITARQRTGLDAATQLVLTGEGELYTDKAREIGSKMQQAQYRLLNERQSYNSKAIRLLNWLLYSVVTFELILTWLLVSRIRSDVAKQKINQEKFGALLDAAPDATVIADEKGTIVMANNQAEILFGYSKAELVGQPIEILVPIELRKKHVHNRGAFTTQPNARPMGAGLELQAVQKGGNQFPVEISLSPIRTVEGLLVSASVRDITQRKNLENNLRKTNAEMESFSYSVSHDLRAPLRGVLAFASILESGYGPKLDQEGRRIIGIIKGSTVKMGNLIDDLLTFSRLGRQEIVKNWININILLKEVIQEQLESANHKVVWNIDPMPETYGDLHLMKQVWINLISNAIKYSSHELQPEITIGGYIEDKEVVYYIRDNGVGFEEEYKHKLFHVFQRLHTDDEFEGTGVGLAIVEKIISRHNGKIWATARVGHGASFYFSLPFK